MNALVTAVPLILIRFGLMRLMRADALKRAAFFPPLYGREKAAYFVYQLSNLMIFVCLGFARITSDPVLLPLGLAVYALGIVALAWSVVDFARPGGSGINTTGLYRVSRNPMYVAYFLYYLGCALLAGSTVLLALLLVFQTASHLIILSEERRCTQMFGEEYRQYMGRVRRYL